MRKARRERYAFPSCFSQSGAIAKVKEESIEVLSWAGITISSMLFSGIRVE